MSGRGPTRAGSRSLSNSRVSVSGVRCPVSGVRCPVSGVRCPVSRQRRFGAGWRKCRASGCGCWANYGWKGATRRSSDAVSCARCSRSSPCVTADPSAPIGWSIVSGTTDRRPAPSTRSRCWSAGSATSSAPNGSRGSTPGTCWQWTGSTSMPYPSTRSRPSNDRPAGLWSEPPGPHRRPVCPLRPRGPLLADELGPLVGPGRAGGQRPAHRPPAPHRCGRVLGRPATGSRPSRCPASCWTRDAFDEVALRCPDGGAGPSRPAGVRPGGLRHGSAADLAEALGIDPSAETEALHTAILRGPRPVRRELRPRTDAAGPSPISRDGPMRWTSSMVSSNGRPPARAPSPWSMVRPGIGKSRLLEVWSARVESEGSCVVRVAADELGLDLPCQPLLDVVTELVRRFADGHPDAVLGLEGAILGPMIGLQTEPAGAAELAALTDPDAGQALLFGALTGVLRRLAEREPLVLVLDDVHLADAATLRWLAPRRGAWPTARSSSWRPDGPRRAWPFPMSPPSPWPHSISMPSLASSAPTAPSPCTNGAGATPSSWLNWPPSRTRVSFRPASAMPSKSAVAEPGRPGPRCAPLL